MAECVEKFPLTSRGMQRVSQYNAFMDGQIWKLALGVDIKAKHRLAALNAAAVAARRRGMRVKTRYDRSTPGFIYMQFTPTGPTTNA